MSNLYIKAKFDVILMSKTMLLKLESLVDLIKFFI